MPITVKDDGTVTADGHAWVITDYQKIDGFWYRIDVLCAIQGQQVIEKVLKRTKIMPVGNGL